MSLFRLAMGLIREAATTETGQEILNDIRSTAFKGQNTGPATPAEGEPAPTEQIERWRQSVEERLRVGERNTEMMVRMHNAQEEALIRMQKRQRTWNVVLGTGLLVLAATLTWLWWV